MPSARTLADAFRACPRDCMGELPNSWTPARSRTRSSTRAMRCARKSTPSSRTRASVPQAAVPGRDPLGEEAPARPRLHDVRPAGRRLRADPHADPLAAARITRALWAAARGRSPRRPGAQGLAGARRGGAQRSLARAARQRPVHRPDRARPAAGGSLEPAAAPARVPADAARRRRLARRRPDPQLHAARRQVWPDRLRGRHRAVHVAAHAPGARHRPLRHQRRTLLGSRRQADGDAARGRAPALPFRGGGDSRRPGAAARTSAPPRRCDPRLGRHRPSRRRRTCRRLQTLPRPRWRVRVAPSPPSRARRWRACARCRPRSSPPPAAPPRCAARRKERAAGPPSSRRRDGTGWLSSGPCRRRRARARPPAGTAHRWRLRRPLHRAERHAAPSRISRHSARSCCANTSSRTTTIARAFSLRAAVVANRGSRARSSQPIAPGSPATAAAR